MALKKIFNPDGTIDIIPPDTVTMVEAVQTTQEGDCTYEHVAYIRKEFVKEIIEYMLEPHQVHEDEEMRKRLKQNGFSDEDIANVLGRRLDCLY